MNISIASLLKARIEDLPFVDKIAGLVRVNRVERAGTIIIRPIACDVTDPLACTDEQLAELVPDEAYSTIIYFEDRGLRRVQHRTRGIHFISQLRMVVWVNTKKLGGSCNTSASLEHHLVSAIRSGRYNSGPFIGILHDITGIAPRGRDLFSQYTYDEAQNQYLMPPYDAFAIDIETEFRVRAGCEDEVSGELVECWTAPTTGRRKHPKDFTCEELQDPTNGLTETQLNDCLNCDDGECPECLAGDAVNSDDSIQVAVPSGGQAVFPDTTVNNTSGTVGVTVPSGTTSNTFPNTTVRASDGITGVTVVSGGTTNSFPDSSVRNSDSTYDEDFPSGGEHVLPDVEHTQSDGTPVTLPAMTPMVCDTFGGAQVFQEDAAGSPVLFDTLGDGDSYTDARVAIRNTADTTDLEFIAGGVVKYVLKQLRLTYTNAAGVTQGLTPNITGISTGRYLTDLATIARFVVFNSNGVTVFATRDIITPTLTLALQPVKNSAGTTVSSHEVGADGVAPDATAQLVDSADVSILNENIPSGVSEKVIAPDGTVTARNSLSTNVGSTAVKSNGTATINIANSIITDPTGGTHALPATVALNVNTYRTGIMYQRGLDLTTGERTSYGSGSEGNLLAAGRYDYTMPPYPTHRAERNRAAGSPWITLLANNTHGNTNRFTDEGGAQTFAANLVVDHLTGLMWYRTPAVAATWATALSNAAASAQGGLSLWRIPTRDELTTIINNQELLDPLNYAPMNVTVDLWSNTTAPNNTANAMRMVGSSGFFNGLAKTSTAQYILVRTHLS